MDRQRQEALVEDRVDRFRRQNQGWMIEVTVGASSEGPIAGATTFALWLWPKSGQRPAPPNRRGLSLDDVFNWAEAHVKAVKSGPISGQRFQ